MSSRPLRTAIAVGICGASALIGVGVANGAPAASTTVTIKGQSTGDFNGLVKSPKPAKCAKDRKVVLFKQKGQQQNPSKDTRVVTDTTFKNGDRYEWNAGNTGMYGKFYARAPKKPGCKGAFSKTVRRPRP